jgi:soluble lytic murein transglycosylase-like protein
LLALVASLSCAVWPGRAPEDAPSPPAPPPAELRVIEAQFEKFQTGLNAGEIERVSRAILEEAERNDIAPELILALIHTESAFDNFARSHVGALGLMQVMPATGEMLARRHALDWKGPDTLFDPVANVRLGCRYLAFLRARYGRIHTALAAYNWGPGAIDRRIADGAGVPQRYPSLVLARLDAQFPATVASR